MIPQAGGEINILILLRAMNGAVEKEEICQLEILGKSVVRRGKNEMALNAQDKDFKYRKIRTLNIAPQKIGALTVRTHAHAHALR